MLDRVFIFDSDKYGSIFLNGPYQADTNLLLKMYIDWYHSQFAAEDNDTDDRACEDFIFRESRCPINFYDDYKEMYYERFKRL